MNEPSAGVRDGVRNVRRRGLTNVERTAILPCAMGYLPAFRVGGLGPARPWLLAEARHSQLDVRGCI
jgi:hypothetical protein